MLGSRDPYRTSDRPCIVYGALGGLTRAVPAPAQALLPEAAASAYVRAPGARPRDGDAVRRSVPLAARVAARQSATCGTFRRPTGAPHGQRPERRRPRLASAAGGGDGGGSPTRRGVVAGGARWGTAPGLQRRPGSGDGGAPRPGCCGGRVPWRKVPRAGRHGWCTPVAPPGRNLKAAGSGGGGDRVDRRRSRRAARLRPLAASESDAAPPGLSPMDTQLGAPIRAS